MRKDDPLPSARDIVAQVFAAERICADAVDAAVSLYAPIAADIARRAERQPGMLTVGVSGAQASGKSTMARVLHELIVRRHGLSAVAISIDDIYLPAAERARLAAEVHPLLRTRGVPGTHDVQLGLELAARLANAEPDARTLLPSFDKAADDRRPLAECPSFVGRADVFLIEGWCVGARPQPDEALAAPVNALERVEDAAGIWRRYANAALAGAYQDLFGLLDMLVMLRAPSFEAVFAWRREQEVKLAARLGVERDGSSGHRLMDDEMLARFIAHYERLTRHMLVEMPARADVLVSLRPDRTVADVALRPG